MNLVARVLGFLVFFAALAGATYGAYQAFPPQAEFAALELSPPSGSPVNLLAGVPTAVTLGAENTGDVGITVRMEAPEGAGYTFEMPNGPRRIAAAQTATLTGQLTVPGDTSGSLEVRLVAVNNETGKPITSVTFPVAARTALPPTVDVTTSAPAAVPGGTVTFTVRVTNPAQASQRYDLTAEGLPATFEPPNIAVPPNGTGTSEATVQVPTDATGTFEALIVATNQAGQRGTGSAAVELVPAGQVRIDPLFDEYLARPGSTFSVPFMVFSALQEDVNVDVEAEDLVGATLTSLEASSGSGGFVTLQAPGSYPEGGVDRDITFSFGDVDQTITVHLAAPPAEPAARVGTSVAVDYIGRLTSGEVFDTSFAEVMQGTYPKASIFQPRPDPQPLTLGLNPQQPGVIQGFFDAVLGLRQGETTTALIPPSQGYGGARVHQNISATTELPRTDGVPRLLEAFPKAQLPPEFDIANKDVGDEITYGTEVNGVALTFRFRVVAEDEQTVDLERIADVGETTTFYSTWPDATEVVEVNETHIVYRTTPPEDLGAFTWDANPQAHPAQWPDATTVQSVNETTIVLVHEPEDGATYQVQQGPGAPPVEYVIERVTEDDVQVSSANPSPLGGRTLIFDVYLREVRDSPQGGGTLPGGG